MSNQDRERMAEEFFKAGEANPNLSAKSFQLGWQAALSAGQATEPVACSVQLQLDDAILAQGEIGRLKTVVREHEETIRQLVRALREATEGETFMGEPVLRAAGLVIPEPPTGAARDVLAERQRQISVEMWTHEHDDVEHDNGELARAAAAYAYPELMALKNVSVWPWGPDWWKPKDARSNMVKACALGLAEIERLDRAAPALGDQG